MKDLHQMNSTQLNNTPWMDIKQLTYHTITCFYPWSNLVIYESAASLPKALDQMMGGIWGTVINWWGLPVWGIHMPI